MNLFKKFFNPKKETIPVQHQQGSAVTLTTADLSLDDIFVHNFIKKGGKFLYCTHQEELNQNLLNIIEENDWEEITCLDDDLSKLLTVIGQNSCTKFSGTVPILSYCEHLVSDNGSVMFSSNQVQQHKLSKLPNNFIVIARTSQLVRTISEGLMAIRKKYVHDFPTNISSIKSYMPGKAADDFLSYGNANAKNLYLLLLEDL
ncbi:MAG: LUD domain-containing protein [Flavobacteriaceae bacterium]|nr:LUD domain-containing protein [Flavobacteriaceae bacterium]